MPGEAARRSRMSRYDRCREVDWFKKTFTTESKHSYFEKNPRRRPTHCLFAVYTPRQLGGENDFLIHASKRALNVIEDISFHRARCCYVVGDGIMTQTHTDVISPY